MNHQPAAPRLASPKGKSLVGLCFLILLVTTFAIPSFAAGASGTVSLSIRLEVGIAGLQRGESFGHIRSRRWVLGFSRSGGALPKVGATFCHRAPRESPL